MRYIMLTQNNLNDQNTVLYEIYGQPHINPIDLYQYQIPNEPVSKKIITRITNELHPPRLYQKTSTETAIYYFFKRSQQLLESYMTDVILRVKHVNKQLPITSIDDLDNYNIIDSSRIFNKSPYLYQHYHNIVDCNILSGLKPTAKNTVTQTMIESAKKVDITYTDTISPTKYFNEYYKVLQLILSRPIFNHCIYKVNKSCYIEYAKENERLYFNVYVEKNKCWMIVFTIEINTNDGTIEKHSTLYDILNSAEMIGGKNIDRQIWKEFLRLQQKLNASYSVLCVANIYQALISTHIMTLTYLEEKRDQLTTNITVEKPQKKTKIYAPDKKRRITSHIGPINITADSKKIIRKLSGIIRYSTPQWDVRGHYRHYKSGKVVYIAPHQNKRKNLNATDETTKRTIILKGENEKTCNQQQKS